jgi:N-acetylneuraminate synthase/N,N'-diacetyllegionaminate synthase
VNHNGDLNQAKELVRQARQAGADCVKFQTFKAERVVTASAPKAAYQLKVTDPVESQFAMLRKLELSESDHRVLIDQCRREGIVFLSTPYSLADAELLHALDVPAFKIASGQLIELPFLAALARFNRPVILSTGMGTLAEVKEAVDTLRAHGNQQLVVLQCTTNYPSRLADTNLRAMATLAEATGTAVGYSDHTEGITACLAAVALGSCVIEKHFTLDHTLPGPDHRCSSEPAELTALVRAIRDIEISLGDGVKRPAETELANLIGVRRSIVTARDLPAGHVIGEHDLQFLRPATGLPPRDWDRVVGRRTTTALAGGTLLAWEHIA